MSFIPSTLSRVQKNFFLAAITLNAVAFFASIPNLWITRAAKDVPFEIALQMAVIYAACRYGKWFTVLLDVITAFCLLGELGLLFAFFAVPNERLVTWTILYSLITLSQVALALVLHKYWTPRAPWKLD